MSMPSTQLMQGKVANLESMVSGHCRTLIDYVITIRTSCFDIDLASQMKETKFPLIHSLPAFNWHILNSGLFCWSESQFTLSVNVYLYVFLEIIEAMVTKCKCKEWVLYPFSASTLVSP